MAPSWLPNDEPVAEFAKHMLEMVDERPVADERPGLDYARRPAA